MILIREEKAEYIEKIKIINQQAFGRPVEADIVDWLCKSCPGLPSLMALANDEIVGHILFSPAKIECVARTIEGLGLAPAAVPPARQRQGIGKLLVRRGQEMLRGRSCPFIIVLGHPEYYPRFSFERASVHGIASQWEKGPNEAFMIQVLQQGAMQEAA